MVARIYESKENNMSQNSTDPGHGNSVASWTTVIIVIVAFCIGTLFFWLDVPVSYTHLTLPTNREV